jgi:hypothetical protein
MHEKPQFDSQIINEGALHKEAVTEEGRKVTPEELFEHDEAELQVMAAAIDDKENYKVVPYLAQDGTLRIRIAHIIDGNVYDDDVSHYIALNREIHNNITTEQVQELQAKAKSGLNKLDY